MKCSNVFYLLAVWFVVQAPTRAADIGTAFTYQGFLEKPEGISVTDTCDFEFSLWDALAGPNQIGTTQTVTGVTVSGGVFTVGSPDLDFGAGAFDGTARWLEIAVRCPGDAEFVPLTPRVELTPAPYALRAAEGVGPPGVLNVTPEGNVGIGTEDPSELLDVAGNIHASGGISSGDTIKICGQGLTDLNRYISSDGPMELYVDHPNSVFLCPLSSDLLLFGANRALRLEKGGADAANVNFIGGHWTNNVAPGVDGATISGGGGVGVGGGYPNQVAGDFGTIGGGNKNDANGPYSTIAGGSWNSTYGSHATIGGGFFNRTVNGTYATVGGGDRNVASGNWATVPGGWENCALGNYSFAAGRQAMTNHIGTFVWADSDSNSPFGAPFTSTGIDQFLIRASGGVGIGTNSPSQQLHVHDGAIFVTATGNGIPGLGGPMILLGGPVAGPGQWGMEYAPDPDLGGPKQAGLNFWRPFGNVNWGNYFLFLADNTGNVGIGTSNPANILTVVQFSPTDPIADAWTTYSSRRWKENITPIPDALGKVKQLRGVYYDWKKTGKHDLGMIAEEVGKVVPEVVAYEDNGMDAKSIDYARVAALLVEAVKEQQGIIDANQYELDELRKQKDQDITELREKMGKLEALVNALAAPSDGGGR